MRNETGAITTNPMDIKGSEGNTMNNYMSTNLRTQVKWINSLKECRRQEREIWPDS